MADNHIFVGNAKLVQFQDGGYVFNLEINIDDLGRLIKERPECVRRWKGKGDKEYKAVRLTMAELREPDDFKTHYIKGNLFVPSGSERQQPPQQQSQQQPPSSRPSQKPQGVQSPPAQTEIPLHNRQEPPVSSFLDETDDGLPF